MGWFSPAGEGTQSHPTPLARRICPLAARRPPGLKRQGHPAPGRPDAMEVRRKADHPQRAAPVRDQWTVAQW